MLCLPLQDSSGAVFAATQLLVRRDRRPARAMIGSPGDSVRLLQVTDPHLFGDEARKIYGVTTAVSLRKVLAEAFAPGTPRPAAILVTGDIADDHSAAAYDNFRRALRPYGLPVFCLPGNHDEPGLMVDLVGSDGFQYGGTAEFGAWDAVFIDTHVHGRPEGRVERTELSRLETALQAFGDRPILVCLHHPPLPVGSTWLDGVGLRNASELLAIIERHPTVRAVLGGHVHQEFEWLHGHTLVLTTPSTCAQFTPRTEHCEMDLRPPGYRWLELLPDGQVRTEVRWLQDWEVADRPPDDRFLMTLGAHMKDRLPFPLLDTAAALASCNGWTEEVYRDLLALQEGAVSHDTLDAKYLYRRAILTLDLTGFTVQAMQDRPLNALLRILDAQKVCIPALHEHGALLVRAFADDLVGLFDEPGQSLDTAFEIHLRVTEFNHSEHASEQPALACIGIGYGQVYAIGPNPAMGDEMNRASKLGEDTARGNETLVTSNAYCALRSRSDVLFEQVASDDQLFSY